MPVRLDSAERLMVMDLGPWVRAGIYARSTGGYRILAVGSAPSTLDAPHFDLTPACEDALADAAARGGSFAFPQAPHDGPLAERAPAIAAVTGGDIAGGPTAFLLGNLVQRDQDELTRTIAEAGLAQVGHATTSGHAFRERVDGPAALDVVTSRTPDTVVVALTGDDTGESLAYIADLLVGGLAGHESGYLPRVVVLYGGVPEPAACERLQAAMPTTVFQVYGGSPTEPMDMGTPLAALQDAARAVQRGQSADRIVPAAVSRAPQISRAAALSAAAQRLSGGQELDCAVISYDYGDVTAVSVHGEAAVVTRLGSEPPHGRPFHLGLHTPVDRVGRWTTDDPLPAALQAFVLERTAHPTALPATPGELQLAHAIWTAAARDALRGSGGRGQPAAVDLAVITGDIVQTLARPVQAALVLINSLETAGVTQLALDTSNALGMSGSLLQVGQPAAVESSLVRLGACVALQGDASLGNAAVGVEVQPAGAAVIEREVTAGSMDVIQWDADVEAQVRIWPAPEFDAGLGYGRPVHLRAPIVAGSIGLVIDARGRPLVWPDAPNARQAWVGQWHRAINAYPAARPRQEEATHAA
ncbi:MAG: hypothetical protein OXG65_04895 [Chloroflexi bacterium]|nr:hypothetical protein [Chloroflexota bacterium]